VVVLDRGLKVLGCNQAARRLLAAPPVEGEVFALDAVFAGPEVGGVMSALDAVLDGGRAVEGRTAQMIDAQGQMYQASYSAYPLAGPSQAVAGVILVFRELDFAPVSAVRLSPAEGAPPPPRMGYQALFEHLAEGIFTIDTRWRITSFNRRAERITGYRREEVLGRHCWEIFRSDLCETGCPLRTTLERGVTRLDQDVRMVGKGGRRFTVLVNTAVVRDGAGRVVGAVESFRPLEGLETPVGEPGRRAFADIVGASEPMRRLFRMLPDLAASEANVLIQGESGTGKELFARAIHHHSPRRNGPFVAVNCSALAESLLESELFGHEKAAFTGAVTSKVGRFELAKGGTLFLDEIGDLKPALQVKLLRVLEQRVFERVGGTRLIPMQARIISATNRDLKQALRDGSMREDLFYRLRTVPLTIPPLRERREDIPLLVEHFIAKFNALYGKQVRAVDPKVMRLFMDYPWPGNVRELERVMEHAFVFVKGPVIFLSNLPALEEFLAERSPSPPGEPPEQQDQRRAILEALRRSGGRRAEAARLLGISRTSLWRRMKRLGLG
jgi:PAS domain S-box-containing protein